MSNLLFNIRFGTHHFQVNQDWKFSRTYNPAHDKQIRPKDWKWFEVYCAFGKHFG